MPFVVSFFTICEKEVSLVFFPSFHLERSSSLYKTIVGHGVDYFQFNLVVFYIFLLEGAFEAVQFTSVVKQCLAYIGLLRWYWFEHFTRQTSTQWWALDQQTER